MTTRRDAIKAAAFGGAVVWAMPALRTVRLGQVGTPPPSTTTDPSTTTTVCRTAAEC